MTVIGHTKRKAQRLDTIEISTWRNDYEWCCCLRDYDEGTIVFGGKTQREAINELLDYYEQDNGEIHE